MLQKLIVFIFTLTLSINSFAQISKEEMRQGVIIAQAISRIKTNEMNNYTSTPIEYEEFVSISIIALQAIYKKGDPEMRTPWSLCGRLWKAIDNEMCARYEDINRHYKDVSGLYDNSDMGSKFFKFNLLYATTLCYEELINNGKDAQEKQTLISTLEPYHTFICKQLSPEKKNQSTGNAKFDNGLKLLKQIFNQRTPETEWINNPDVEDILDVASGYYYYMFTNDWGENDNVVKCEISENGILANRGYRGSYYLLQLGDWNISSTLSLDVYISSLRDHDYDLVLYKDGKCYVEHFNGGTLGVELKREKVSIDIIETLNQAYNSYIEEQNGDLHELI